MAEGAAGGGVATEAPGTDGAASPAPPPQPKRQLRLPRWWRRAAVAGAVAVALVAGLLVLTSTATPLRIRSIEIEGIRSDLLPSVLAAVPVAAGDGFGAVDASALEDDIRSIEGVEDASVGWAWWNRLSIVVVEQTPVGAVPARGGYVVLDAFGEPIRRSGPRPAGMPVIEAHGEDRRQVALETAQQIPEEMVPETDAVLVGKEGTVQLRMRSGGTADLGAPEGFAEKFAVLAQLLKIGAAHMDVSVPERPTVQGIPSP